MSFRSGTYLQPLDHLLLTPLKMLFWGHTAEEPPTNKTTIGHENTGYVVGIGKDVQGFKIGDLVGCLGCSYACCMCMTCLETSLY